MFIVSMGTIRYNMIVINQYPLVHYYRSTLLVHTNLGDLVNKLNYYRYIQISLTYSLPSINSWQWYCELLNGYGR